MTQSIPIQFRVNAAAVQQQSDSIPEHYALQQNYPNPFSLGHHVTTMIKFQLPRNDFVTIRMYNVLGQEVRTLLSQHMKAGYHHILWDEALSQGHRLVSGIYFYRFQAGDFIQTKKMLIVW